MLAFLGSGPARSQERPIRAESSLVLVPVAVLDSHGLPVRGLAREDFEVVLGKTRSPVQSFDVQTAVAARLPRPASPAAAKTAFSNLPASSTQADVVAIVLVDFLNTALGDRRRARQQALEFFAREIGSGQWVAAYGLGYRL